MSNTIVHNLDFFSSLPNASAECPKIDSGWSFNPATRGSLQRPMPSVVIWGMESVKWTEERKEKGK